MPSSIAWDKNAEAASKALGCRTVKTLSGSVLPKRKPLAAKFQIGSIKGECNYAPRQQVFHVTQIPRDKLALKRKIKRESRPDPLGVRGPHWNISCAPPEPLCKRRSAQNRDHDRDMYKFNYRCEVLPPGEASRRDIYRKYHAPGAAGAPPSALMQATMTAAKDEKNGFDPRVTLGHGKRTMEMPVHPDLEPKCAWDGGTALLPLNHATNVMLRSRREEARKRNSARRTCEGRPSLKQRFRDDMEIKRKQREEARAQAEGRLQRPATALPSTRNRFAVEPDRRFKRTTHSGVWGYNAVAGCCVWSDTMSEQKDSRGDVVKTINPDAWNLCPLGAKK